MQLLGFHVSDIDRTQSAIVRTLLCSADPRHPLDHPLQHVGCVHGSHSFFCQSCLSGNDTCPLCKQSVNHNIVDLHSHLQPLVNKLQGTCAVCNTTMLFGDFSGHICPVLCPHGCGESVHISQTSTHELHCGAFKTCSGAAYGCALLRLAPASLPVHEQCCLFARLSEATKSSLACDQEIKSLASQLQRAASTPQLPVFPIDGARTCIRPSRLLRRRGKGLFADEEIAIGTFITWYTGRKYLSLRALRRRQRETCSIDPHAGDYVFTVTARQYPLVVKYWIDGYEADTSLGHSRRCAGTYLNHHTTDANVVFEVMAMPSSGRGVYINRVAIRALRDIEVGEELLIDYGEEFAKQLSDSGELRQ